MSNIINIITSEEFLNSILLTLKITIISTLLSYIIGIPLGVLLYGTSEGSIFHNKTVNAVVGFIVNIIRSIPFVILLIMTQPLAKLAIGSKVGSNAFIFHLVIAAAPFVARMIEASFREVDAGVIEAAQSMGSNNFQIMMKVIIPEAKPSLIVGSAIAITTILGYTPMASYISGGGLGAYAVNYGLYRSQEDKMYIASLFLIILVQILQESLNYLAKLCDKRIRNK